MNDNKFDKMAEKMRQDMKVVARELLVFADKNEKEVVSDFQAEMDKQIETLDLALDIIEKEASAL